MEANNIKIPFWIKIKTMLFGKSFFKGCEITTSKYTRIFLHILNYTYIFGGWIFIADYLDNYFKGIENIIALFIILFILNLVVIYFSNYHTLPTKRKCKNKAKKGWLTPDRE